MKKQNTKLGLLTGIVLLTSLAGCGSSDTTQTSGSGGVVPAPTPAEAKYSFEDDAITTVNNSGKSMWVTIYNAFGMIRDEGCVPTGTSNNFHHYYGELPFAVRTEVTANVDCSGQILHSDALLVTMGKKSGTKGIGTSLRTGTDGFQYFRIYPTPTPSPSPSPTP